MNQLHGASATELAGTHALLFRAADRLRLESHVAALTQKGMSLSLVSTHEAILDHYGKILVDRLRTAAPDAMLEVYFPADSDALLARFNEALGSSSVRQAMDGVSPHAPPRIWIVHDAGSLPDHEIQLLARLVQNFPGANVRVVLFMTAASQKQKLLDSFGRRILCWDIEPPTAEQAKALLEQARNDGSEGLVRSLLKKLATPGASSLPAVFEAAPRKPFAQPVAPSPVAPKPAPATSPPQTLEGERRVRPARSSKGLSWVLVAFALLLVSTLLVAMFHVASPNMEGVAQSWKSLLSISARSTEPALVAAAPAASSAQVPAPLVAASAPAAPAEAASAPTALVIAASPPAPAASAATVAATVTAIIEPAAAPASAPVQKMRAPEPLMPAQDLVELPAESLVGQAWVQKMPRGIFLVQHVSLESYQEAVRWLKSHPELKRARVVATYMPKAKLANFVVVSGPFSSLGEASRFVEKGGIPKDPMIRSARFMKEQFTPELANAYAQTRQESRR